MINEKNFKDVMIIVMIAGLFILALLVLKPVIFSIIWGVLLAYIFYPIYKWILKRFKNENLSAFLICILLLLIILIPTILILNSLIKQAINFYLILQYLNLESLFKQNLPSFITSLEISKTLADSLNSLVPKALSYFISKFGSFILNIPVIIIHVLIVIFIFFLGLRDGKKGIEYLKSLSPFAKETEDRFFKQFKDVTNSVLFGQVIVGLVQGIVAGIGYFILGVPYALLLTIFTMFVAIIPFIGAWLGWIPVDIYLFAVGRTNAGIGLLIYGVLIVSLIDNLLRPIIISRRTKINSAIVIIGMIGGMFVFGVIGLILGPLILSYILLVTELYKSRKAG